MITVGSGEVVHQADAFECKNCDYDYEVTQGNPVFFAFGIGGCMGQHMH